MKIFLLIVLCFGLSLALSPPIFPKQFFQVFEGANKEGPYNGSWAFDYVNQRDLQVTSNPDGSHKLTMIDRYDLESNTQIQAFFMCWWIPDCESEILVPPMRPFAVPADAKYIGKKQHGGKECDVWEYAWNSKTLSYKVDYYVVKNDTFYYPIYLQYTGDIEYHVTTTSFELKELPESYYDVPESWGCHFGAASPPKAGQEEYHLLAGFRSNDDQCPPVNP